MAAPCDADDAVLYIMDLVSFMGGGTLCGGLLGAYRESRVCPPHQAGHYQRAWGDGDIFYGSQAALIEGMTILRIAGAYPATPKDERVMRKWLRKDMGQWETNSLKLMTPRGVEINLVYKTVEKKPLRTALEQVGSFDFSNLGPSIDIATGEYRDLSNYFWPEGQDRKYTFFPDREEQWLSANVGLFTGIRQADRYSRNVERLYDLAGAKEPLIQGYRLTAAHYFDKSDPELQLAAKIYMGVADLIEVDDIDGLREMYRDMVTDSKVASLGEGLARVTGVKL